MSFLSKLVARKKGQTQRTRPAVALHSALRRQASSPALVEIYGTGDLIANRYEVIQGPREKRSLTGGMGLVYLCVDRQEGHPVALKTFQPQFLPDCAARDRFLREGTTWVKLGRHPHIVRAYGVEYVGDGREVYLVLELVKEEEGHPDASLRSWLVPGKPMPVEQALLFSLQVARGMAHATAAFPGLVHRDLKPENVLVGADRLSSTWVNRVRVTDFGLAAVLQETSDKLEIEAKDRDVTKRRTLLTQRGIVGTPEYMAPEQWEERDIDLRADIYALGCILVEMLTGQMPVKARPRHACCHLHQTGQVLKAARGLPKPIASILDSCLAVNPSGRYTSWEGLETVLVAAYTEVTGQVAPGPEPVRTLGRAERVAMGYSYNALGLSYRDIGKAEVALRYFEQSREAGQAEGERLLEAAGVGNLGLAYADLGEARRAIGFFEQELAIAREICAASAEHSVEWAAGRHSEGRALSNLGNARHDLGEVRRAIGFHEQALTIAHEIGDRRGEVKALCNLGNAYADLGEVQRAIGLYGQELAIRRELSDRRGEARTLDNLGAVHADLGEVRRAIGFHEQALVIACEIGDPHIEVRAQGNLGIAHKNLGEARQAIGFYEQALAIAREIGDRHNEGMTLGNLGNAYTDLGEAQRAIGFHEQALAIACEIGDRRGEGVVLNNLGCAYRDLDNVRRAIRFFEQALTVAQEIGNRTGEGNVLNNLGNAFSDLGDVQRAVRFYEQALAIAREFGSRRQEGIALGNLGIGYRKLGDVSRAIGLYEQALAITREVGDRRGEGKNLGNLGIAHIHLGDAQRATEFHKQHLAIAREIGDRAQERIALDNLGNAYAHLGDAQRAVGFHEQHMAIAQESGEGYASAYLQRGSTYWTLQRYDEAISDFNQAIQYDPALAPAYRGLGRVFVERGDLQRALPYLEKAAELGDTEARQSIPQIKYTFEVASALQVTPRQLQFALAAIREARSIDETRQVVIRFPFVAKADYIEAFGQFVAKYAPMQFRQFLRQRLGWLRQIADEQKRQERNR